MRTEVPDVPPKIKEVTLATHRSIIKKRSPSRAPRPRTKTSDKSYNAPALEKGLAILEIVTDSPTAINAEEIARTAGRSRSEIYRMIKVLERHGYIFREASGEGYSATNKLFALGMRKTPITNLHGAALPEMRRLSDQLHQSVSLVVPSDDQIVFIAGIDSGHSFSLSVPLGFRRPVLLSNSGRVLFAFQPPERQLSWLEQLRATAPQDADIDAFLADAEKARRAGWLIRPSVRVEGVTDICAPIWTAASMGCAANLIVPLIRMVDQVQLPKDVARVTRAAADRITEALRPHMGPPPRTGL